MRLGGGAKMKEQNGPSSKLAPYQPLPSNSPVQFLCGQVRKRLQI
jgi:hypothetical protein